MPELRGAVFALDRTLQRLRRVRHLCRGTGAARGRRPAGCSCVCGHARLRGGDRVRGVPAAYRYRRARPRAGRRARRWLARASRRGAGHRQVDAAAAGGRGHRLGRHRRALRVRRGVASAGRAAREAPRSAVGPRVAASGDRRHRGRGRGPGAQAGCAGGRLDPDRVRPGALGGPGQRRPGARVHRAARCASPRTSA